MTRLSVQLYSLRNAGSLERQLDLVRESGLGIVELTSSNFDAPLETRRLLDERGLVAPSGHVGVERLRGDLDGTARTARELGLELLVLWGLPDSERWTDREGWEKAGRELGGFARRLADRGLRFAFHNHDWELGLLSGGAVALDVLFAAAADAPLEWQADIAWLERGGSDAGAWTVKRGPVLRTVHVKDLARPGEGTEEDGWADLGAGRLDWATLWPALERRGVELFVLEHDEPSDPARFLARSTAAARRFAGHGAMA